MTPYIVFPETTFPPFIPSTIVGEDLCVAMIPWLTLAYCCFLDSIGTDFEQVAELITEIGDDGDADYVPAWGTLFNVETCPTEDLPYLGQYVGVSIPVGTDDATSRSLIESEQGMQRGTPAAIIAAAKRFLTATQSVSLIERRRSDGTASGYAFVLVVRPEELTSASALIAAVDAIKPGGVMWSLVQTDFYTWTSATGNWNTDTMMWDQTAYIAP